MKYGPTPENMELIRAKAGEKANGVYRFRGVVYRVRDKRVTHIAHNGKVLERYGHFDVEVGVYDGCEAAAANMLRSI
ncbi:MAG TPA: hypothetical protein VFH31_05420 [Pyrinomonadaceae bacterium]|nr:hypothetical protein [Pyrinomonadaceae bacterium]